MAGRAVASAGRHARCRKPVRASGAAGRDCSGRRGRAVCRRRHARRRAGGRGSVRAAAARADSGDRPVSAAAVGRSGASGAAGRPRIARGLRDRRQPPPRHDCGLRRQPGGETAVTLIDDRGRLFGRINLVDAGVALLGVAAAAGLLVAYQVFRLPRGPEVVSVQPATQAAVNGAHITLRGRDFLPFLRVFVRRSGGTAGMVHENDNPYDAFTLVNQTQAPWVVESPLVAEVRLPDGMGAGTYDLAFSNETRQLSIARAAFTLTSPPPPPTLRPATAIVRLEGAFTRLTGADAQRLTSGAHLVSNRADESIEILAAAPSQPDVVQLDAGRGAVPAAVDARVRVPATLRVRCTVAGTKCLLGGATITAAGALRMRLGAQEIGFIVDEVAPGFSDAVAEADVTVRFLLRPEEA